MEDSPGAVGTVRIKDPYRLRSAINARGMTVQEVADRCGVSRQLISRLINDPGRSGIAERTARCVSEVVRVDFDRLWLPTPARTSGNDCP